MLSLFFSPPPLLSLSLTRKQKKNDDGKINNEKRRVELGELPAVKTAATLFQQLCYNNKDNLQAGIICAGWDRHNGGSVYNIPLGGSLIKQPFAIGGSGSTYIYGYCDAYYKDDMTKAECRQFVINGKISWIAFFPIVARAQ